MSKWFSVFIFSFSFFFSAFPVVAAEAAVPSTPPRIVFNAVKTDGTGSANEFVSLYNIADEAINLQDWIIEYSEEAPAPELETCSTTEWESVLKKKVVLSDVTLEPQATLSVYVGTMLDDKSGAVRLLQPIGQEPIVHDVVGWGSSTNRPYCSEAAHAKIPSDDELLARCITQGVYQDTDDNSQDFTVVNTENFVPPTCPQPPEAVDQNDCESVAITEVLPNPAGADDGNEFIEIHNPTTATIQLYGCGLATTEGKEFMFTSGAQLAAGGYRALYDSDTEIGLTNSKSVGLLIVTADEEFLRATYPADLEDNISWALIEDLWQETDNPTPGAPNKPMTPKEAGSNGGDEELAPCPAGKFRNPLTNRCKSIVLASAALTPCKPGQTRNPETNRCRSTTLVGSSLIPCKPGQERNPSTNRCRKVASASTLKPCKEGEERNPDTNRCRKIAAVASGASPADKEERGSSLVNYGILGLVGTSALGYGAYEYRNDLRNKLFSLKSRFFPGKSGNS